MFATATTAWVGSALSIALAVAMAWAIIRLARRDFPVVADRSTRIVAIAGAAYFLSGLFMEAVHLDAAALQVTLQRLPFLAIIPLVSRLALSPAAELRTATGNGALAGAAIAMALAIWQLASGYERAEGFSGNPGPFALGCVATFFLLWIAALREREKHAGVYAVGATAAAIAVAFSGMRSFWLSLFAVAAVGAFVLRKRPSASTGPAAALSIVLVAAALWYFGDAIALRFARLASDFAAHGIAPAADTSLGQRLAAWSCAFDAFKSSPLFGLGVDGAHRFLAHCTADLIGAELTFSHFHNVALNALANGGIVEFLATAGLLLAPATAALRAPAGAGEWGKALLVGATVLFLISGLFGLAFGHDVHDAVFLFLAATGLAAIGRRRATPGRSSGGAPEEASAVRGGAAD